MVRGAGSASSNTAAVAILETYVPQSNNASPVCGLARMVQVGDNMTVCDISLTGVAPGRWGVSVRQSGDLSGLLRGEREAGGLWRGEEDGAKKGWLGYVEVGSDGKGAIVSMGKWKVWEVIGRGFMVEKVEEAAGQAGQNGRNGEQIVGVIARSAGVWDNNKTVCSCSGKTVWEERVEQKGRGIL